jgi:hypothetical protein
MKDIVIKALAFSAVVVVGWQIGGIISIHTMTLFYGFLFGAFVGIPAMLIIATRAQTVRHDHYHHAPTQSDMEPQKQPLQLPERPTRYIVIANRPVLPTVVQNKLEVSK